MEALEHKIGQLANLNKRIETDWKYINNILTDVLNNVGQVDRKIEV